MLWLQCGTIDGYLPLSVMKKRPQRVQVSICTCVDVAVSSFKYGLFVVYSSAYASISYKVRSVLSDAWVSPHVSVLPLLRGHSIL